MRRALSSNSGRRALSAAGALVIASACACALFSLEPPCHVDANCAPDERCHATRQVCVAHTADVSDGDAGSDDGGVVDAG